MKIFTPRLIVAIAAALLFEAAQQEAVAGSATWSANPSNGDWNTAANWSPNTIPNSASDIATFGHSTVTNLSLSSGSVSVDSIVYEAGASPYTITTVYANLSLYGSGIVNNSGILQSLNMGENLIMFFYDFATAGEMTSFGGPGGQFVFNDSSSAASGSFDITTADGIEGSVDFNDSATAGNATITIGNYAPVFFFDSSTAANAVIQADAGGFLIFAGNATADHTTITLNSDGSQSVGSGVDFEQAATAANGSFTANGATSSTGFASDVTFIGVSTAGDATFILNGGSAKGAAGTAMNFYDNSKADNASVTVNGGTNDGEGASVIFHSGAKGGTARFILSGNGTFDLSDHNLNLLTTGSIEGSGVVLLGARPLAVGSNNLSTTFSGSIEDGSNGSGGSLSKLGAATLTLSGASTYTGSTTVSAGALVASNPNGSATGTGSVAVNSGTLGGGGTISGAVTVGTGSGTGATLQPSFGTTKKVALTIQSLLTFKSNATYSFRLKSKSAEAIANGVTIENGAQFSLTALARKLPAGKTATVIKNTAATPISGTFANLPDGGMITSGANTFKANYEGGDGNDLTLTVQ